MKAHRLSRLALFLYCTAAPAHAQAPRNLLTGRVTEAQVATALVTADRWHPYPTIAERDAWKVVSDSTRAAYIRAAEQQLGKSWGDLPATLILQYKNDGIRAQYDRTNEARRLRLANAVMAEVFENRGRFLGEIADGIWSISEQTFWGSTAHLGLQKAGTGLPDVSEPVVDLFAAEAAATLAWTDYLLGARLDTISPLLRPRIRYEVERRVLMPALQRDDFWWMGFGPRKDVNNWNPWINSNWLASALILERNPARRSAAVYKIMRSVDNFLNIYPADGSCDEGPSYWSRAGGSLFDNLELMRAATNGRVDIFDASLVRNIGEYIGRAYIANDWYVNMGDAPAKLKPDAELIYSYGARIHSPAMQGFGAMVARRRGTYMPGEYSLGRILSALVVAREVAEAPTAEPLAAEVWFPDLQFMSARATPGSTRGLYVAAWGASNGKSHNHNDVGNFIVFSDGEPVLIDAGVGIYTAKTFSAQRYDIWTMQSAFHNLPTINGVMEKDGKDFHATDVTFAPSRDVVRLSLDIAKAYPDSAHVNSWRRTVTLDRRANQVDVSDAFVLERAVRPTEMHLMTPLLVDTSVPGTIKLRAPTGGRSYSVRYDAAQFRASAEEIPITDSRLRSSWGDRLARVTLAATRNEAHGTYRITVSSDKSAIP